MKTKAILLFLLGAGGMCVPIKAQKLNKQLPGHYAALIVARVYEMTTKAQLSNSKQEQLAILFKQEDSLLNVAFVKGFLPGEIDKIRQQTSKSVSLLLSPAEEERIYTANALTQTVAIAKAEAIAYREKYHGDDQMERRMYQLNYAKYREIAKIQQQFAGDSTLTAHLKKAIVRHDTILCRVTEGYNCSAYFDTELKKVNAIKPLTSASKEKMLAHYSELCRKTNSQGVSDNFRQALKIVANDTVYYGQLNRKEIAAQAVVAASRQFTLLTFKNKLSSDCKLRIYPALYEKEKRTTTILGAYRSTSPDAAKMLTQTSAYYDSVVNRLLISEGVKTPKSVFFDLIRDKKKLHLTEGQVKALLEKGLELNDAQKSTSSESQKIASDPKKFERLHIQKILDEDQLNKYLIAKKRESARQYAQKDWNEIIQRGLAQKSDSAKLFGSIRNFQLARCVAIERYLDDVTLRYENLNAIDESMPDILRKLKISRRIKATATADTSKNSNEKGYRGTFQW